ncbi:MAG: uroporphyrinogen-III synthase [Methylobacteriaceae bacterium]|nr:uroporphyrinogen-III synthase [Methylobacteriaceae bacterium]
MKVLVVRAAEDARRTAARLRAAGHEALVAPAIEIRPIQANFPTGRFDAVIATSAHAFGSLGSQQPGLAETPLYVVGGRTAEAAERAGFPRPRHVAANAGELVEALDAVSAEPARLLYLAGRDRRPEIEAKLGDRHDLSIVETYVAEARGALPPEAAEALRRGAIDAVLHYSRRSAEVFLALVRRALLRQALRQLRHIAISEDAARPLVAAGLSAAVAAQPNEDSMFAALGAAAGLSETT